MEIRNKKVLVFGLAKSGLAAIKLLNKYNCDITLCENKEIKKEDIDSIDVKIVKQDIDVFKQHYDLCVKNPGIPYKSIYMDELKKNKVPVITEIELGFCLAKPQHYIAITGTNGKTTTTTLVYNIINKAFGNKAHLCGNIGTPLCDIILNENLLEEANHYIALEMSNFQLVNIDKFKPELAVIMNLTPDHVDFMGSLEEYYWSKTLVYKNMDKNDTFILNSDDPILKDYVNKYPIKANIEAFSLDEINKNNYVKDGYIYIENEKVLDTNLIKIVGKHNLQNVMVAVTIAKKLNISNDVIQQTVAEFNGVEHRIEFVKEINGVKYYNDSKGTNTDATITALKAFDKNVILLVGGYEKGLSMDEMNQNLSSVKQIIGYGACGKRLVNELKKENNILVNDLKQAVLQAYHLAQPGDIVLLSPTTSSFDQYHSFEERGEHFKSLVFDLK